MSRAKRKSGLVWMPLARRFREADPYGLLILEWRVPQRPSSSEMVQFGLLGPSPAADKFMTLAKQAGSLADPGAVYAMDRWFELLRDAVPKIPCAISITEDSRSVTWHLINVADASARLCALMDGSSAPAHELISRRKKMLDEYKARAGVTSDYQIITSRNAGIHRPQFYEWKNGTLPSDSVTTRNFENFLKSGIPPMPRKRRD